MCQRCRRCGDGSKKDPKGWFKTHGPLVHFVRNGQFHDSNPYGVGQELDLTTSTPTASSFLWTGDPGDLEKIPVAEALSQLTNVGATVRQHILDLTGKGYISFS